MIGSAKIGLAMSGGVDSTVAALLLKEQGYAVYGFFILLPLPDQAQQIARVSETAARLHIPLQYIDLREAFRQQVIAPFLQAYQEGKTPNPCVLCNRRIKFGLLENAIRSEGMDLLATGHYAQCRGTGRTDHSRALFRAADRKKDQSYFLCRLNQKQLSSTLFPLGHKKKEAVYRIAARAGFLFQEKESQDVCFLPNTLYDFLRENGLQENPGPIVGPDGSTLGTHNGISRYTIGQRRGLGLPDATPWYVTSIDAENNQILVGKQQDLLQKKLTISALRWLSPPSVLPFHAYVQLRSTHLAAKASINQLKNDRAEVIFEEGQRAVTPGQFAVFYEGTQLIGSGIIERHS